MSIDLAGALTSALTGIRSNFQKLDVAARRIASEAPSGDLEGNLVEMIAAEHGVAASVQVTRSADRAVGTLLDVLG